MKLSRYIKDNIGVVIVFLAFILITDLVVIAGSFFSSTEDILYLNLLLASLGIIAAGAGYMAWKSRYRELYNAIRGNKPLDYSIPSSNDLTSLFFKKLIEIKNAETSDRVTELNNSLYELKDYIIKWAHEIKIPISVCELISERITEESEDMLAVSEELRLELERIKFLVNQVLYIERASSYSEDLQMEEADLALLIKDAVKRSAAFFISKDIELRLGNLNYSVMTDKKWLAYILDQILNNAGKYVEKRGLIEIFAREHEKFVTVHIKDNGTGIAPKDINRVFDRGFTGDNGRKVVKSTGMGLYFSKKISDRLCHKLEVSSIPNDHTEFTITIYKFSDYFNVSKMSH